MELCSEDPSDAFALARRLLSISTLGCLPITLGGACPQTTSGLTDVYPLLYPTACSILAPEERTDLKEQSLKERILVVGAGFAGATYAREIAESGYLVDVIDRRGHIGGNAFDETLENGIRVHHYGPHLLHTNSERVVEWLRQFGEFVAYRHRVTALLPDGQTLVPLPINRKTINMVFGLALQGEAEVSAFLGRLAVKCEEPRNAAEYLTSQIGTELTDLFFRPYTKKMWALDLEDMGASVVKRIPLRYDDEDHYFPGDKFQLLPQDGYTGLIMRILDHPKIKVMVSTPFDKAALADYDFCFNSMPIDEYFEAAYGPLPYRSIRFHHREEPFENGFRETSVVNFTDTSRFTRQTDWSRFPCHVQQHTGRKTLTNEEPCDYRENNFERYYPVKTSDGRYQATYAKYKELADRERRLRFIGRCGTYQYLDMDQVINQSLRGAHTWLATVA
jgi:UDP-galactopyranose mutase